MVYNFTFNKTQSEIFLSSDPLNCGEFINNNLFVIDGINQQLLNNLKIGLIVLFLTQIVLFYFIEKTYKNNTHKRISEILELPILLFIWYAIYYVFSYLK